MKKNVFFLAFVFIFSLFSFTRYTDSETIEEAPSDTLYVMGCQNYNLYETLYYQYQLIQKAICLPPEELAFTGDDIKSYNPKTKELLFKDSLVSDALPFVTLLSRKYRVFNIYLNDKLLFDNIFVAYSSCNFYVNDISFYYPGKLEKSYLDDGFPPNFYLNGWEGVFREIVRKEREENREKRKDNWDIFINYLRKAGKLIEDNTNIEPIAPQQSDAISIHPNPTTGELRIKNYETTFGVSQLRIIENVEIFDIMGKKLSTVNYQLSTDNSIDISHLPAGIYFVRIMTDKGGVTKKVVKK